MQIKLGKSKELNNITYAWSKHHDSSPLQKKIQSAWDNIACRDSLKAVSILPSETKALLELFCP